MRYRVVCFGSCSDGTSRKNRCRNINDRRTRWRPWCVEKCLKLSSFFLFLYFPVLGCLSCRVEDPKIAPLSSSNKLAMICGTSTCHMIVRTVSVAFFLPQLFAKVEDITHVSRAVFKRLSSKVCGVHTTQQCFQIFG